VANINRVIITSNLTADPELQSLPSGTSVCRLRVAVNRRYKDSSSGEWTEKPNYFTVKVWGAQTGEELRTLKGGGFSVAYSPRSRTGSEFVELTMISKNGKFIR